MDLEYLRNIGLAEGEIKVYSAILESGQTPLAKIHEKTSIERRNIYDIINKLIEKGLASYIVEKGKKVFQITHPNKIIDFIEEKQRNISNQKNEIESHIPDLISLFNQKAVDIKAEVYRGNQSIRALLEEALNYKENYWLGGNGGLDTHFPYWWKHFDKKRIAKKVKWYDLADHGLFLSEYKKSKLFDEKYYELRFLPEDLKSPMVIFIFGNKVAQILWSKQSFAFVLESKEIAESYLKYFNYFWEKNKKIGSNSI
jgi:HTH-type transcriptional regulator, sugar sensing transcriptional regulator